MLPLTDRAVRASFVNCTKGETQRLAVPRDLADQPWPDLDFYGWRDPSARDRGYLVAPRDTGLVGVALRVAAHTGHLRRGMCSLCLTTHPGDGVSLMTARKSTRRDDSVGIYICGDLACPLHVRGKLTTGKRLKESLTTDEQLARMTSNLSAFLDRVTA
ncbi:FBP domain-containing protein [Actinokineospora inagensis]|uniref:FBP domain-containing protein n=1 Tax=Actinokineospora inagensis TaxID=103730 RepID=UPI00041C3074|nr:FBP domain-containing protein [Actinokineospora inagensis]